MIPELAGVEDRHGPEFFGGSAAVGDHRSVKFVRCVDQENFMSFETTTTTSI
uniref:Uncharacterized protein n=1 Tax=Physcomitrium patens TaxID=3218 RepID=A0A2K1JIS5_PHYPA|nr:hypothetical protein PHYPA_018857 [Physcomitrium patens]